MRGMASFLRYAALVLAGSLPAILPAKALAGSDLGVGTRLKGAPSTVSPPPREILPQIFRPDCRWRTIRQYDPNLGWVTRRVMVCE